MTETRQGMKAEPDVNTRTAIGFLRKQPLHYQSSRPFTKPQ